MFDFLSRKKTETAGKKLVLHLYSFCRDEELLLPYFFQHYDYVDKFTILFDTASIDSSKKIIDANPKCERVDFTFNGEYRDDFLMLAKNSVWKESIGIADWVIVVDLDEFIYHPSSIRTYLARCMKNKVTIPLTEGFDMFSDFLPTGITPITQQVNLGVYNKNFCKNVVFNPNELDNIYFFPGSHRCDPEGNVQYSKKAEITLLHYKYLGGLTRMRKRWITFGNNLSDINIKNGWSVKRLDVSEIERRYLSLKEKATKVI